MTHRIPVARVYLAVALLALSVLLVIVSVAAGAASPAPQAAPPTPISDYPDKSNPEGPAPADDLKPGTITPCVGGFAGPYPCNGINLYARVPLTAFAGNPSSAANLWGYVDLDDMREYAIIGLRNSTGVVDITDPVNPVIVGTVAAPSSSWREVKVLQFFNATANRWDAYAYISTEAPAGIQIIDLSNLPNSVSLAATYTGVSTVHTLFISNIDWSTNVANQPGLPPYLYLNGSNLGGLRILSLANPTNLQEVGFWTGTYVHDIYTHVFTDTRASQCQPGHNPCEVVFDFGGNSGLRIIDVTNKSAPVTIGSLVYSQLGYTHSGWIAEDPGHQFLFLHDELDEQNFGFNTRIRTIDISNLNAPTVSHVYSGPTGAIDHNGYTLGNKFYYASYTRGIAVLDVTDPNNPNEVAFFDTYPSNNGASFNGAWGVYPYLPSGNIIISDIQRGLFVVREEPPPTPTPTITPGGPTLTPTSTRTPTPTPTPRCGPPDPFGYRCDDTVTRAWITATLNTGITGDDQVVSVPIGFTFDFYGSNYTTVNVSSNGNLQFTTSSTAFSNACPLPSATLGKAILPFWDDLYPPGGGGIYYSTTGTAPNRVFTVEWRDIEHFPGSSSGVRFEVQLEETTGDIYLLYQDVDFGDPSINNGASASVGAQNTSYALTYSCDEAALAAGRNIRFYRPTGTVSPTPTPTATVPTATAMPTATPTPTPLPPTPTLTPRATPTGATPQFRLYLPIVLHSAP